MLEQFNMCIGNFVKRGARKLRCSHPLSHRWLSFRSWFWINVIWCGFLNRSNLAVSYLNPLLNCRGCDKIFSSNLKRSPTRDDITFSRRNSFKPYIEVSQRRAWHEDDRPREEMELSGSSTLIWATAGCSCIWISGKTVMIPCHIY
jgi:hypothetical protein